MTVREVTTATATITGDEALVHPRGVDRAVEAEVPLGAGAGVAAPGLGDGIEDGHRREVRPHPQGSVVDSTHVHHHLVVPGDPGRTPLPLGGIHEAMVLCHHLQGVVHLLLPVVIAVARLVELAGRVRRQGPLRGRALPRESAVVLPPLVLRCQ